MCGHAIIALATMTLDTGMVNRKGDSPVLKMDTPAGQVTATAHRENGCCLWRGILCLLPGGRAKYRAWN